MPDPAELAHAGAKSRAAADDLISQLAEKQIDDLLDAADAKPSATSEADAAVELALQATADLARIAGDLGRATETLFESDLGGDNGSTDDADNNAASTNGAATASVEAALAADLKDALKEPAAATTDVPASAAFDPAAEAAADLAADAARKAAEDAAAGEAELPELPADATPDLKINEVTGSPVDAMAEPASTTAAPEAAAPSPLDAALEAPATPDTTESTPDGIAEAAADAAADTAADIAAETSTESAELPPPPPSFEPPPQADIDRAAPLPTADAAAALLESSAAEVAKELDADAALHATASESPASADAKHEAPQPLPSGALHRVLLRHLASVPRLALQIVNLPAAAMTDTGREAMGAVAIITLVNAMALLLYLMVFG